MRTVWKRFFSLTLNIEHAPFFFQRLIRISGLSVYRPHWAYLLLDEGCDPGRELRDCLRRDDWRTCCGIGLSTG